MPTYAVQYEYDDRHDVQDDVRPAHRAFLRALLEDGALLASGPLRGDAAHDRAAAPGSADTPTGPAPAGALLLLRADSAHAALRLLDADPFRGAGVIAARSAREWDPVIGPFA